MAELSVLLGLAVLLAVALGPAHRHSALPFHPGEDTSVDRDRARLVADLRAAHPATHGMPHSKASPRRRLGSLGRRAAHAHHPLPGSSRPALPPNHPNGDSKMTTTQTLTDRPAGPHDNHVQGSDARRCQPDHRIHPDRQLQTEPTSSRETSTSGSEHDRGPTTAGLIAVRILVGLVLAMITAALIGFAVFDGQDGDSTATVVSGALGISAGVIGLLAGFIHAYQLP